MPYSIPEQLTRRSIQLLIQRYEQNKGLLRHINGNETFIEMLTPFS